MPLVSSTIPNLVGGVSQQPPALRLPTASTAMENAWPSVVSGNQKRQASDWIAKPSLTISGGVAGYLIDRDPTYRYAVLVTNGDLKVVNLNTGTLETVTFPYGKSYLTAASPVDSFRFVTIGDTTFIANRNITVTTSVVGEPVGGGTRYNPDSCGVVYVAQATANTYYTVYIDGVLKAQYLTPTGTDAATSVPDTGIIASYLISQLSSNGYVVGQYGSTIVIYNLSSTTKITTQANSGEKSLKCFKDTVQSFSDLPPIAPDGLIVKVAGDAKADGDDYYVIQRGGVWVETVAYGNGETLAASAMPHKIIRNGDGTWTFTRHAWSQRVSGNASSNQTPSFVGFKINDIFVYQNRMGFLADENVILSEADTYENFYRTTVAQVLDSDRIDIAVLNTGVEVLNHAVPYNRDLLLSSETAQFRLTYQNYLSPKTAQIKFTTAFNMSKRIKPINMGNSVYFIDDRADYSFLKVWEYFPKDLAVSDDADDVTAQIPEYIKYDASFFAGSNRVKAAVLSTSSDPSTLYIYKYFWNGERKVQTSWNKWTFDDCVKIHWGGFAGKDFYMLVQRSDGLNLERIIFDEDVFDTNKNYHVLVDRRSTPLTSVYNPVTDQTTITLRWSTTAPVEVISTEPGSPTTAVSGYRHTVTKVSNNVVTVMGDISAHTITVGIPYTWLYEFSPMFFRQQKGQGEVVVLDGRVQLRYITVEYHNTATFAVNVQLSGRDTYTTRFNGRVAGSSLWNLGQQAFASGKYRIAVMGQNTESRVWLTNDSPFPSAFGTAEWQGIISPKSVQRV